MHLVCKDSLDIQDGEYTEKIKMPQLTTPSEVVCNRDASCIAGKHIYSITRSPMVEPYIKIKCYNNPNIIMLSIYIIDFARLQKQYIFHIGLKE